MGFIILIFLFIFTVYTNSENNNNNSSYVFQNVLIILTLNIYKTFLMCDIWLVGLIELFL